LAAAANGKFIVEQAMSFCSRCRLKRRTRRKEAHESKVQSKLNLTQVGRVCVTIADTDRAIDFYVDKLGFEKVVDEPMGPDMRWVEVAIPGTPTTIALAPPPPGQQAGGSQTGICLDTTEVDADHAALKAAGVDVDEDVTRYGGPVPPMFWLRDPDGNSLIIVQPSTY
jgi:catechol 2,3-dioxygenase-like lactoylglutathione lyase family enzyme